jgi:hypothetical protein
MSAPQDVFTNQYTDSEALSNGEWVQLYPGTPRPFDTLTPLAEAETYNVVSVIKAGSSEFLLLDIEKAPAMLESRFPFPGQEYTHRFLLVDESFSPDTQDQTGWVGINPNQAVTIGRGHFSANLHYDPKISVDHFKLMVDAEGNVAIVDLDSTNGTKVFQPGLRAHQAHQQAQERARQEAEEARRRAREQARQRQSASQSEAQTRLTEQQRHRQRAQAVAQLPPHIREVVSQHYIGRDDLPIEAMAGLVSRIHAERARGDSDRKIYIALARELHPEGENGNGGEELFRFVSQIYDGKEKKFRIRRA